MAYENLPGTSIIVRSVGLITPGRVATGNIGIVGTAKKGLVNKVYILSNFSEAKEIFGDKGEWNNGIGNTLTLVRALEQIFNNGGTNVYAVRTCKDAATTPAVTSASFEIFDGTGSADPLSLKALSPGTWGNNISIKISESSANAVFSEEIQVTSVNISSLTLTRGNIDPDGANSIRVKNHSTGVITKFVISDTPTASSDEVDINETTGELTFANSAPNEPAVGDTIYVLYEVKATLVELKYQSLTESYIVADAAHLCDLIEQSSNLIQPDYDVTNTADDYLGEEMDLTPGQQLFSGGGDAEAATADDYTEGLSYLENETINLVLLAGQDASQTDMLTALVGHVELSGENKKERIGIIGSDTSTAVPDIINQVSTVNRPDIIFVSPGMAVSNQETLPGAYTAAAVTGLIASLPVQSSPTNKTVNVPDLAVDFKKGQLSQLLDNRVLAIERRDGFRVVKGINTSVGALQQISIVRILFKAKYLVRSACDPYIGKLNNERVRGAMDATIRAALDRMVDEEALISYELEVTATRAQEIAGEAIVTMTILPTFSIDFIRVVMYLQ